MIDLIIHKYNFIILNLINKKNMGAECTVCENPNIDNRN
jgi:hypothetical protein